MPRRCTRRIILQKARHQAMGETPSRPLTACQRMVSGLFHSPYRGAFHRSLTVLIRYRSSQVGSLGGWSPQFPTGFLESRGTQALSRERQPGRVRESHPLCSDIPVHSPLVACSVLLGLQHPVPVSRARFGLLRVRSPLLAASRLMSLPQGTEMFQFPWCPSASLCIQDGISRHDAGGVAPFGDSRLFACARLPVNVSARAPSFIGL